MTSLSFTGRVVLLALFACLAGAPVVGAQEQAAPPAEPQDPLATLTLPSAPGIYYVSGQELVRLPVCGLLNSAAGKPAVQAERPTFVVVYREGSESPSGFRHTASSPAPSIEKLVLLSRTKKGPVAFIAKPLGGASNVFRVNISTTLAPDSYMFTSEYVDPRHKNMLYVVMDCFVVK